MHVNLELMLRSVLGSEDSRFRCLHLDRATRHPYWVATNGFVLLWHPARSNDVPAEDDTGHRYPRWRRVAFQPEYPGSVTFDLATLCGWLGRASADTVCWLGLGRLEAAPGDAIDGSGTVVATTGVMALELERLAGLAHALGAERAALSVVKYPGRVSGRTLLPMRVRFSPPRTSRLDGILWNQLGCVLAPAISEPVA